MIEHDDRGGWRENRPGGVGGLNTERGGGSDGPARPAGSAAEGAVIRMAGAPARELDVRVGVFRGPVVVQQGIGAGEGRARTKEDSQQEGGDEPPGHALITP
jgi:hypothetical protein